MVVIAVDVGIVKKLLKNVKSSYCSRSRIVTECYATDRLKVT